MDTQPKATDGVTHASRVLPAYVGRIRELRKACGQTQAQFAREIKAARISIARWETGTRAPSDENYRKLAEVAAREGIIPLREFFLSEIEAKRRAQRAKIDEKNLLADLERVEEAASSGDSEADEIFTLAAIDAAEYAREQLARILKAREELANGEFSTKLSEIASMASRVGRIREALALRERRRIESIERRIDELLHRRKELDGASEALRREIGEISLAWRGAKEEGPDLLGLTIGPLEDRAAQIERKLSQLRKERERHAKGKN
jgi:transcriptional regulator with XRE-family HTH domain